MKPTNESRSVLTNNLESSGFEISQDNAGVIMDILANGIYTDKILAVLREYSANAWDAHRMVGKGDVPIKVTLPTRSTPTLRIRDFGPGLSHDDVFNVYCKYGNSTKRNTNDAVGMLGIGSKSGFAYSDTFTVISRHTEDYDDNFVGPRCGMLRTYVSVLDDSEKGKMGKISLLGETACDPTDSGVEIVISVRSEDIYEFENKAKALFQHFSPRPEINVRLPSPPDEQTVLANGAITTKGHYGSEWIAIMGCVPYKVTLTQLDLTQVSKCLPNLSGSLFFDIGDVQISSSREELRYSTTTKAKLVQKFNDLVDEYVLHALEDLERPGVSEWDKRLKLQVLVKLDLPLPGEYQELATMWAKITYAPGTFTLLHNKSVTTRITVSHHTRLLIDDTGKGLDGYMLGQDDYVVRGDGKSPDEVRVLLDAALAASGLTGVKIYLLSALNWNAPYVKPKKFVNPKHKAKMFTLTPKSSYPMPLSNHWETVTRIPEDTDVYVLISGFDGFSYDFFADYKSDRRLAEHFGLTMPTIYGYKTSEKRPAKDMLGTEYRVWRAALIQTLLTPDNLLKIANNFWHSPSTGEYCNWPDSKELPILVAALGDTHPISQLVARQDAAKPNSIVALLAERAGMKLEDSEAGKTWNAVQSSYPLLRGDNFNQLWETWRNDPANWVDYVQMIDERNARLAAMPPVLSMVP
jgi:hypothetical protein